LPSFGNFAWHYLFFRFGGWLKASILGREDHFCFGVLAQCPSKFWYNRWKTW
jgi:hypothetical protein